MTIWTGVVSSNFTEAGNWDSSSAPGSGDLAVIASGSNAPVLNGSAVISALEYASSSAELQVFGQLTAITAEVSGILSLKAGSTSTISTLVVATGGRLDNHGSLTAGNSSEISSALGLGNFNNFGELTLNGAVHANLSNDGKITVNAPARIAEFATLSNTAELVVNSTLTLGGGRAGVAGNLEINLNNSSLNPSGIFAQGVLSVGLNTLVVDTAAVGSLTAGNERTLLHTSVTAMDAFSIANYAVIGQHAEFAYALRLVGLDEFVSSLTLLAINDGATGGRAVLDEALSSRAITLDINSDTWRGTIRGGSFADAHASLLHGVDEVRGGSGHDVLRVTGGTVGFTLAGNQGDDTIRGGAGADTLDGGIGTDSLAGGAGDDRFFVDATADLVVELAGGGNDFVQTTASWTASAEVEAVTALGAAAVTLTGNVLANKLVGNAAGNRLTGLVGQDTLYGAGGADTLDGGTGNDLMLGGTGDDQYIVDSTNDQVMELSTGGTDTVLTSSTWTASAEVEVITATLAAALGITGNALANTLTGNGAANRLNGADGDDTLSGGAGDDTLEGGAGTDRMAGGAGNDQFILTSGADQVVELAGGGKDTVLTSATWAASAEVEVISASGTAAINLTGNAQANRITGNGAANRLGGLGGADTLIGGAGADSLTGGAGADSLTGGGGRDVFIFANGFGNDRISDFDSTGAGDRVNLAALTAITSFADLKANHLTFAGGNAVITAGTSHLVLVGVSSATLDVADFIF